MGSAKFQALISKVLMAAIASSATLMTIPYASASDGMIWTHVPGVNGWNFHVSNVNGSRSFTSPDDSIVIATTGPRTLIDLASISTAFIASHADDCPTSDACEIASNSDGSYLYAHTRTASVYISRNTGATWTKAAEAIGGREVAQAGDTIAVSPDGSAIAFASYVDDGSFSGNWHVFYSDNFGTTFTNISGDYERVNGIFPNYKVLLFSTNFELYVGNQVSGGPHSDIYKVSFPPRISIQTGTLPNSKVATIPSGIRTATIPASASLPATSLNFGGSVPDSVTVVPVASNPASVSATPFTISGSTKIVDIQISGTFSGSATVCLDGAPTDHLYHFTGGVWVELASRTYVGGQVCGVTTSFSPFAAAAPAALVAAPVAAPVPVPDPVQQSKITALSVSTAIAGTPTPVEITGSFVEKIRAIQINGVALPAGSWTQTASSVAFTMPAKDAGTYQIQLFNGSAPVLKVQNFTFTVPIDVVAPTPVPTKKPKVTYIRCAKPGHGTRIAYGVNPTCPTGYVKK